MIDLRFDKVSKRYTIRHELPVPGRANSFLGRLNLRKQSEDFCAVHEVSFEVPRGQAIGMIGHNGAGKSTVLKLLSKITTPSSGEIMINGRLSALIEVGSGFHPELTGRENIYLSGSILGMLRREISKKLDSIIDFADLRRFIDTPVKRYSSGMYVRLGFSIAAHLDPDILLLDEVLAVGDAAFQAKCLERIMELKKAGITIVFISHDLGAVETLCDRVMIMKNGEVIADGKPHETVSQYQSLSRKLSSQEEIDPSRVGGPRQAAIGSLTFRRDDGEASLSFETGMPLRATLEYEIYESLSDVIFEVQFLSQEGRLCSFFSSEHTIGRIDLEAGAGIMEFICSSMGLGPGVYFVDTGIRHRTAPFGINIDWRQRCLAIRVDCDRKLRGTFYMPYECRMTPRGSIMNVIEVVSAFESSTKNEEKIGLNPTSKS